MNNKRNISSFKLDMEFLIDMLRTGYDSCGILKCIDGVPEDAVYINSYIENGEFVFLFYHPDFPETPCYINPPAKRIFHETHKICPFRKDVFA